MHSLQQQLNLNVGPSFLPYLPLALQQQLKSLKAAAAPPE